MKEFDNSSPTGSVATGDVADGMCLPQLWHYLNDNKIKILCFTFLPSE